MLLTGVSRHCRCGEAALLQPTLRPLSSPAIARANAYSQPQAAELPSAAALQVCRRAAQRQAVTATWLHACMQQPAGTSRKPLARASPIALCTLLQQWSRAADSRRRAARRHERPQLQDSGGLLPQASLCRICGEKKFARCESRWKKARA